MDYKARFARIFEQGIEILDWILELLDILD